MRVLLVDNRYRLPARTGGDRALHDLSRTLDELGHEIAVRPTAGQDCAAWDVVVVSRPELAAREASRARNASRGRTVFLGHDLHHRRLADFQPTAATAMHSLERACWRRYDLSVYPDDDEVRLAGSQGARAEWFPYFRVDDRLVEPWRAPADPRLSFVGGSGHHPNPEGLAWLRDSVLPALVREFPGVRVTVIGEWPTAHRCRFPAEFDFLGVLPDHAVARVLADSTAAVAPLRTGAGVKSKVVDALAAGVPLVSSSVGLQGLPGADLVCHRADTPTQWRAALHRIIEDPASAATRARRARRYALSRFGSDAYTDAVAGLLTVSDD